MYHSYFYFRRLSAALSQKLVGTQLESCFSQERDELVLMFTGHTDFTIKADLGQGAAILSFPEGFGRTRSNSVDLFQAVLHQRVAEVRQTLNDRSFHICFQNNLQLCFKMYGGRSNVLLHNGVEVSEVFNHHLRKDLESPPPGDCPILQAEESFEASGYLVKALYPTFDKWMWEIWEKRSHTTAPQHHWPVLSQLVLELDRNPMYLCKTDSDVILSFVALGEVLNTTEDAIEAGNLFYRYYWQIHRFMNRKNSLVQDLESKMFHARQQMQQAEKQWLMGESENKFRLQADLLMAYSHQVKPGSLEAELPSFQDGKPMVIKLKRELSVAENAGRLYKKAKGLQADLDRLKLRASSWKSTLEGLSQKLEAIQQADSWHALRPYLQTSIETESHDVLPYHAIELLGFEIRVGKSARSNDEILRMAHKDDLWLHARDVPGSHAIIRHKKGKVIPQPVLERAAQLAAFYSRARTESLVAVMVTERKYLRKNKAMAAGQVLVEKEKTLLVVPVGL